MASPIEVQLILCDAAQADPTSGKIHMLGAGWSVTGTPTGPQAVALLMKIPWDRSNTPLPLVLTLTDADGHPVEVETHEGKQGIKGEGTVEVGRPPGLAHGTMLNASFALNVPPLPLEPGRYQWRLEIADRVETTSFTVLRR